MSSPAIDFSKYEQPAQSAPAQAIDFSKYEAAPSAPQSSQPSLGQHIRDNFAEGLGVTSDEGAKNFFEHPIDTLMKSLDAQGQLAIKAKQAYQNGDYKGALMYGLNYLAPFIGQQTAKAGEQLNQGDISGGVARTLGAAVPLLAGSPEARAAASDTVSAATSAAKPVVAKAAGLASDIVDPEITGIISPRLAHVQRALGKLSDALDKSQQAHGDVADLDATGDNQAYAGETARGRKLPSTASASPETATAEAPATAAGTPAPLTIEAYKQAESELGPSAPLAQKIERAQAISGFADRPRVIPSVQNIRENLAQVQDAESQPNRPTADSLEDHALQQEMNQDLERHGWAADSEARREFIARNSSGVTKSDLTGAAEKPVRYTKTPGVPSPGSGAEDLTDLLQRSLAAARKAKAQQ